ncbi:hypothetical protein D3C78_1877080 [compost metagenome]
MSRAVRICSSRSTASPSAAPGAKLKDRLTAGSNASCTITAGPLTDGSTRTKLSKGTMSPVNGERSWKYARLSAVPRWCLSISSTT